MRRGNMIWKLLLVIVALGAVTGLSVLTAVCVCAGMEYRTEPSDCIIVLGAHVWEDGRLSNALTYRCEAALEAWKKGIAPAIIVCGAQGRGEPSTEAEAMRGWMLEHGVPEDRVIAEEKSVNTVENLKNAGAIMEARGDRSAAVCTSDYHLRRALWIARDLGIDATGIAAPSPRRADVWLKNRLRETGSWILYYLRKIAG